MPFTYESICPEHSVIAQARSVGVKYLVQMASRVGSATFVEYEGYTDFNDALAMAQNSLCMYSHYKIYYITTNDCRRVMGSPRYNLRSERKPSRKVTELLDLWVSPHTTRGIFCGSESEFNDVVMISRYFYNTYDYTPAGGYFMLPTKTALYDA